MSDLKRCPFCGGEASYITYMSEQGLFTKSKQHIYCKCKDCKAQTQAYPESVHYTAVEKAAEAWNRRAGEQDEPKGTDNVSD